MRRLLMLAVIFVAVLKGYSQNFTVTVIPSSLRLDPVSNEFIENRYVINRGNFPSSLLKKNWVYDGSKVSLKAARGEYISFQVVVTNTGKSILKGLQIEMSSFKKGEKQLSVIPELFLEWSVRVQAPSTGYAKASLGTGWYPDALIPFTYIQDDSAKVDGRWIYPLWIPDFNNRIDDQQSMIIWVDQFVPFDENDAPSGQSSSLLTVNAGEHHQTIPVNLDVWNFAIPNENLLKASLQHEGFLSSMDEKHELEMYQLFKRNRVSLMDPTYKPELKYVNGKVRISWTNFDKRMKKYFTGKAFTAANGYTYGPGYGEPLETFVLPFDVFGKHGTKGWPDIGKPDVENLPANNAKYEEVVKQVRGHLKNSVNPSKTELIVYLNGLDESYTHEAWERMVHYGEMFKKIYPEASYRIDGGYSEEAMKLLSKSIKSWASHTINYDYEKMKKYQAMGIKDWLYGPMLYESKVNSWVGSYTFTDLPLVNERAISWATFKYNTYSWISWGAGVNAKGGWYDPESWKDQYKSGADSDSGFTYKKINGSALLVYSGGIIPNVSGICPSVRLKNLRNGVQEYEYMRMLKNIDKNDNRVKAIVNEIIYEPFGEKSIGKLDVWSFDAEKWDNARIRMGELINELKK
ncbi:MAG TPA: glycoside hydrolase domain-containing protein [Flavitalea sp.]|nr:glycoside hydrolase domain-containing protein [Flavitalea sp.]